MSATGTDTDAASADVEGADAAGALVHAWLLDGAGGGRTLAAHQLERTAGDDATLWLHVDLPHPGSAVLLARVPGLDARQAALLASDDPRPHADVAGDAVRLVLRGVNLHPDADPEDMVSVRLWARRGLVVSTRRRRLLSVDDVVGALVDGHGPADGGELLAALATRLIERVQVTVDALDGRVLGVEEATERKPSAALRREIADIRRTTIVLRRHLAPQRDALGQLAIARLTWLDEPERLALRDALDELQRHVESLDAIRERATVAREELASHQAALTNERMFLLALLSAVFLPLSFLAGLLGINVGGIPGADDPRGFPIASLALGAVAVALVLVLRFGRWL